MVTVLGLVTDAAGNPLPGMAVTARSTSLSAPGFSADRLRAEGGAPFSVVSDGAGQFQLDLIAGTYSLLAGP